MFFLVQIVHLVKYLMEKTSVNIAKLKLISKARFSPA
uniref:Uncharacterized protein n=1 Tax=Siphoviridae sp. ctamP19 TaxID=2827896 RepID=A0A8S5TND2_9CAUD|nr:MAG TPA: hypothetical protein [Siphoviridae sp. ctamP19]